MGERPGGTAAQKKAFDPLAFLFANAAGEEKQGNITGGHDEDFQEDFG